MSHPKFEVRNKSQKAGAFAVNENPKRDHSTHKEIATNTNHRPSAKYSNPDLDKLRSENKFAIRLHIPDSVQESTQHMPVYHLASTQRCF